LTDRQKTRRDAVLRWSATRLCLLALLSIAVSTVATAPARAALPPTGADIQTADGPFKDALTYRAATGQANNVTVAPSSDGYAITDDAASTLMPATPSGLCTYGTSPASASCPAPSANLIWIFSGNGNDSILLDPSITIGAKIFASSGDDRITIGDSAADEITCGDGSDTAIVDASDFAFPDCEFIDDGTDPETTIDPASGPPGITSDTTARFSFSSSESNSTFECKLDSSDFTACTPSTTYTDLQPGPHDFQVRAIDHGGHGRADQTPAERTWTVEAAVSPPPSTGGVVVLPVITTSGKRLPESLVLIAGRAVKVSKNRRVSVALNCSGTRDCAGRVILATSKPVRYSGKHKRIVRLASRAFQIPAARTKKVRLRISRQKMRLLRRLRQVKVDVIVRDRDRAGRARVGTRTIVLRASR
jgi:hypothetical protein